MTNAILTLSLCLLASVAFAESTTIPLSIIITTSHHEGMLRVHDAFSKDDENSQVGLRFYQNIILGTNGGAFNVFRVEAMTARHAFAASSSVLEGGSSAEKPVNGNRTNTVDANYWMVVYLGIGESNPTRWTVDSVEIGDQKITLS